VEEWGESARKKSMGRQEISYEVDVKTADQFRQKTVDGFGNLKKKRREKREDAAG